MSNPNYTLEIISHHPEFKNRSLKKYQVDGIETVGAWGNEPFEIRFKNNTYQKIQVKLSVDGTDVLTGEPATTEPTKDMWVVSAYGTLNLKAWPETHNGGAQLVFTSANNSVAIHTHGDLSSRGIIAAAVFTEGHVEPIKYNPPTIIREHHHHYPRQYDFWTTIYGGYTGQTFGGGTYTSSAIPTIQGVSYNSANNSGSNNFYLNDAGGATMDSCTQEVKCSDERSKNLESLVAVGAGQHVNQKISYVQGLIKPLFTETVRVKYLWWDDLVSKLKEYNVPAPHASGFPGDKKQNIMSLGATPRIGTFNEPSFPRTGMAPIQPVYSRI